MAFSPLSAPLLSRTEAFLWYFVFAAALFGAKLWLIATYGNGTPFWDQWDAEADRLYKPFIAGTLGIADLFAPHNEHRIFSTRVLVLALLAANSIWSPLLQMVVNAGLHTFTVVYLLVVLVSVVERTWLTALLLFSLVVFGVPYAWENTLAGFQSHAYFVLLFSVACISFTVTSEPFSTRWWIGSSFALLAFLSQAGGIFAAAACAVTAGAIFLFGIRRTRAQLMAVLALAGLFVLGVLLTPSLEGHEPLKAHSVRQFAGALIAVLSWPLPSNVGSVLFLNAPALLVICIAIVRRPAVENRVWLLVTLGIWVYGIAVSIAYGRAAAPVGSRYLDLFAVAVVVNFACLLLLARIYLKRRPWVIMAAGGWGGLVLISLALYGAKYLHIDLAAKREQGVAQQVNTRNYVLTGDISHLLDKPHLQVPYPDAQRLASLLSDPTIQALLPANIRSPVEADEQNSVYNGFMPGGTSPATPRAGFLGAVGSYGSGAERITGFASLRFRLERDDSVVGIPVAGYPAKNGLGLRLQQDEKITPLVRRNSGDNWYIAYAAVSKGDFWLHLTDSSEDFWMAVGSPTVYGRLDRYIEYFGSFNYYLLIAAALITLLLLVYKAMVWTRRTS